MENGFLKRKDHTLWVKKIKNGLNFTEKNYLKLQYCVIFQPQLETFLNFFKIGNFCNQKVSRIQNIAKFLHFANINFRE